MDGHPDVIVQALLMAPHYPGEPSHEFETGVDGPPEPLAEAVFGPSGTGVFPVLSEGPFGQRSTIDLQVQMFMLRYPDLLLVVEIPRAHLPDVSGHVH